GERQNKRGRQPRHLQTKSARAKHTSAVPPHKLEFRATRWRRPRFLALLFDPVSRAGSNGCGREQLSPVFVYTTRLATVCCVENVAARPQKICLAWLLSCHTLPFQLHI